MWYEEQLTCEMVDMTGLMDRMTVLKESVVFEFTEQWKINPCALRPDRQHLARVAGCGWWRRPQT